VIAGRPSMGKSAFALGIASNLALQHGTPVAVFTLEMSKLEVAQRFMCAEGRVELQRLRTGRLSNEDWPRLVKACDALTKAPIYVDDTRLTTMLEIRAKARRLKAREPRLGAVIVDYLQLMSTGTTVENRVQEIAQISRALKVIAGDLEVPVIALSQLNRGVESRTDKRPLLSDLRDSGAVEQDADLVMFLYRDEYYNENSEDQGLAEVILAKHRNGPVGTEKLAFLKRFAKFADLAPQHDARAAA
jgi:replicative DNA helicase